MSRENDKRYVYLKEAIERYQTIVEGVDTVTHTHHLNAEDKKKIRENAKNVLLDLIALSNLCQLEVPYADVVRRQDVWLYMIHGQELTPRKISKKKHRL